MFSNCSSLKKLNIFELDMDKIKISFEIFGECSSLEIVNKSKQLAEELKSL